jgi:hypothetical protein
MTPHKGAFAVKAAATVGAAADVPSFTGQWDAVSPAHP